MQLIRRYDWAAITANGSRLLLTRARESGIHSRAFVKRLSRWRRRTMPYWGWSFVIWLILLGGGYLLIGALNVLLVLQLRRKRATHIHGR